MSELFADHDISFRGVVARLARALGPDLDDNPGSAVRLLVEAFGREISTLYGMLDRAHRAGYVDSAEGPALDKVVAILGVERARAGRLAGVIELPRSPPAPHDLVIPPGFRVAGKPVERRPLPVFESVEAATLRRGETRVRVAVQQVDAKPGDPADATLLIGPGQLTIMPRPAVGIESVTNPEPLRRASKDESDEHLRGRARHVLRRSQAGTLTAIAAAIHEQGVEHVEVSERDGPPGVLDVLVGDPEFADDPEAARRVLAAVRATKAAGVQVALYGLQTVYVRPTLVLTPTDPRLDEPGFRRLVGELGRAIVAQVAAVPRGQKIDARRIEAAAIATPGIADVQLLRLDAHTVDSSSPAGIRPRAVNLATGVPRGPRERLAIDLERWPPRIVRKVEAIREVEVLVETSPDLDLDRVRDALTACLQALGSGAAQGKDDRPLLAVLAQALRVLDGPDASPTVRLVQVLVHDELDTVCQVSADDRIGHLLGDVRVQLGRIERVDAGAHGKVPR